MATSYPNIEPPLLLRQLQSICEYGILWDEVRRRDSDYTRHCNRVKVRGSHYVTEPRFHLSREVFPLGLHAISSRLTLTYRFLYRGIPLRQPLHAVAFICAFGIPTAEKLILENLAKLTKKLKEITVLWSPLHASHVNRHRKSWLHADFPVP